MMLVERDQEIHVVAAALGAARGGRGSTLIVEGPPGIGKSALLARSKDAAGNGFGMLAAVGGEFERDLPFATVRQLLEPPLLAMSRSERAGVLGGAAHLAKPVFGLDGSRLSGNDPSEMSGVLHGLYWLCSSLADRTPLLLAVDDVHWADEASARFLSHLARRIVEIPALLVLAGRPGNALDELMTRGLGGVPTHTLRLRPLSDGAVGLLVRSQLAPDADDEFCRSCARVSGGNPFLLTQALAGLRADGVRPVAGEVNRVANLRPDTIARSVLPRIARLGPDVVRTARAVAVLGAAPQLRHVAGLAELTLDRAAQCIDALAREQILTVDRPIEFVHPLVRSAVYLDSSAVLRAADHRRAARLLAADSRGGAGGGTGNGAAEQIAPPLLVAEPATDPWVVEQLSAAAQRAFSRGAPEVAASYLARALAEPPAPADRGPIYAAMGRALGMANRTEEATTALHTAAELLTEPGQRLEVTLERAWLVYKIGQNGDALAMLRAARELMESTTAEPPLELHAIFALASLLQMEPPTTWMSHLDRVAGHPGGDGMAERLVVSLQAFGTAASGVRPAAATAALAHQAAAGPLTGRQRWMLVNLASAALGIADRSPEALDLVDRGLDLAREAGDLTEFRYLSICRSHTALFAGRLLDAEADGRAALELQTESRQPHTPLAAAVLVDALVERGELKEAQSILAAHGLDGEVPFDTVIAHFIFMARGRLRRHQNRAREALADLLYCGQTLVGAGYTNPGFATWRAEAALAHLALGEPSTAADLATEDLELARRFEAPRPIGIALRVAGLATGGRSGLTLLEEAMAVLERSTAEHDRAHALVDYGAALRRSGRREAARDPLRQGLDLATRCHATGLAGRARDELVAAGARPRRVQLSGRMSLTPSELRIATLAAHGATNQKIAQDLFLARRTVEVHLTAAYRKLGISSRRELAAALRAQSADPEHGHSPA